MEYNLAGIRQRVLVDKLDDAEFDPDVVDNFINDTQRDIFNQYELSFQEKIFSGTIPAGSTMFKFPDDVAKIQSQVITTNDGAQHDIVDYYLPFREFNKQFPTPSNSPSSSVLHWTLYANNMLTSAPTDKEYEMTIFYIKKPAILTVGTDIPEIPEEFSELLVLGALMRIQQRNEDWDLADKTEIQYNRQLLALVEKYGSRTIAGPMVMKNRQIGMNRFPSRFGANNG